MAFPAESDVDEKFSLAAGAGSAQEGCGRCHTTASGTLAEPGQADTPVLQRVFTNQGELQTAVALSNGGLYKLTFSTVMSQLSAVHPKLKSSWMVSLVPFIPWLRVRVTPLGIGKSNAGVVVLLSHLSSVPVGFWP